MGITRLNALDRRVKSFNPAAHERFAAAVKAGGGRAVLAEHIGYGLEMFFGGRIDGGFVTVALKKHPCLPSKIDCATILDFRHDTEYEANAEDYAKYLEATAVYLKDASLPVILVTDPSPFYRLDLSPIIDSAGEERAAIIFSSHGEPKPRTLHAEWSPFRFHWKSMRDLLLDLGIRHLKLIGEFLVRPHNTPADASLISFSDFLLGTQLCLGSTAYHLVARSKGRLTGEFVFPCTFPGLLNIRGERVPS